MPTPATAPKQPETVYVRASWPMARYDFSRTKLWRMLKDPSSGFPAPRYLPGGQRRWLLAELLAWEAKHLAPAPEPRS